MIQGSHVLLCISWGLALLAGFPQQARLLGDVLLPSLTLSLASSRLSRGPLSSGLASWESFSKLRTFSASHVSASFPRAANCFFSGFPRRDPASNCLFLQQFILPLSPIPRSRRHHHPETPGLQMGPFSLPECLDPQLQAVTGPRRSWTSDT
ncbi:hypothetical protein ISCGN_018052 [Ixodes scapularis]